MTRSERETLLHAVGYVLMLVGLIAGSCAYKAHDCRAMCNRVAADYHFTLSNGCYCTRGK